MCKRPTPQTQKRFAGDVGRSWAQVISNWEMRIRANGGQYGEQPIELGAPERFERSALSFEAKNSGRSHDDLWLKQGLENSVCEPQLLSIKETEQTLNLHLYCF